MSTRAQGEIASLAGARAIPPLLLVLYHYHEGHGYQHIPLFDVFIAKGYLWVEFFFALSGFVLTYAYGGQVAALWSERGYTAFLRNRLARLYPVHLAMIVVLGLLLLALRVLASAGGYVSVYDLPAYHPDMTLKGLALNLLLVQAWHTMPHLSWNGVAWFVSVEFFLCLVFPVFAFVARGSGLRALLLLALGLLTLHNLAQDSGHGLDITFDWGIERGLADFSVGVAMAMLFAKSQVQAARLPDWLFTVAESAVFAGFLYAIYHTGWSHNAEDFWVALPMMLIVLPLAYDRGAFARVFALQPFRLLGEWSYAIYMGQTLWLMLLRFAQQRLYPEALAAHPHLFHVIEPALLVLLCTGWGALLYYGVERPANRRLRAPHRAPGLIRPA